MLSNNRTKIIATIGPATSEITIIENLIRNGCSIFRVNFSHGAHEQHAESIKNIRQAAKNLHQYVAILGDLQGPKIRIGSIIGGSFPLENGQILVLDSNIPDEAGSPAGVSYKCDTLAESCEPGRLLVLDDGRVTLKVTDVQGNKITTEVVAGDVISSRKGLNLKGGGLSEAALTDKDFNDIRFAKNNDVDYLCVSFPASYKDMELARGFTESIDFPVKLIAKLERAEVVANIQEIDQVIKCSDGIMVARGDLAVEVGFEAVTMLQKDIIQRCRTLNKPVIVATQMMESMIDSPVPTRAEVSDVANAVYDYADAVMLSAETAVGKFPVQVIKAMRDVIVATETASETQISKHRVEIDFEFVDESIAMATMYAANHFKGIKAILCLTESGSTALWMSRIKTALPMFAMSSKQKTLNAVALYRGVFPVYLRDDNNRNQFLAEAVSEVTEVSDLQPGDYVAITLGDVVGVDGNTNTLKILKVTEN